jgi:enoyl-CoA hydratase/carnithine racemase
MNTVLSETRDRICTLTLNRPHRLNAMTEELVEDFGSALSAANRDPAVDVILLQGAGRAFCAGDDLKEFETQTRDAEATRRYLGRIQDTVRAMFYGEKPIVGAAQGWAAGGGFEWLINCDLVVMGEGTRCFFPEVSLDFIVTGGVTALLPCLVGLSKAREMILLGEKYTAAELRSLGLVHKVVPDADVQAEARRLAERIAGLPLGAVRSLKRVMNRALGLDFEGVLELEREAVLTGFYDPGTADRVRQAAPRRGPP